jgi:hypothetical protein
MIVSYITLEETCRVIIGDDFVLIPREDRILRGVSNYLNHGEHQTRPSTIFGRFYPGREKSDAVY